MLLLVRGSNVKNEYIIQLSSFTGKFPNVKDEHIIQSSRFNYDVENGPSPLVLSLALSRQSQELPSTKRTHM